MAEAFVTQSAGEAGAIALNESTLAAFEGYQAEDITSAITKFDELCATRHVLEVCELYGGTTEEAPITDPLVRRCIALALTAPNSMDQTRGLLPWMEPHGSISIESLTQSIQRGVRIHIQRNVLLGANHGIAAELSDALTFWLNRGGHRTGAVSHDACQDTINFLLGEVDRPRAERLFEYHDVNNPVLVFQSKRYTLGGLLNTDEPIPKKYKDFALKTWLDLAQKATATRLFHPEIDAFNPTTVHGALMEFLRGAAHHPERAKEAINAIVAHMESVFTDTNYTYIRRLACVTIGMAISDPNLKYAYGKRLILGIHSGTEKSVFSIYDEEGYAFALQLQRDAEHRQDIQLQAVLAPLISEYKPRHDEQKAAIARRQLALERVVYAVQGRLF